MAREQVISTRSIVEPQLRIKQRDYTIPVRLNQLPVVLIKSEQTSMKSSKPKMNSSRRSELNQYVRVRSSGCNRTSGHYNTNLIQNKISIKSKRFLSLYKILLTAGAFICLTLCLISKSTLCDNNSQSGEARSTSSQLSSPKSSSTNHNINQKRNSVSTSHKEHLLSYLSDNIERQHFMMKPSRAFAHQRPSKFDSGDDLNEQPSLISGQSSGSFGQKSLNPSAASNKVDQGMRHIMQMHEQVHHHQPASLISSSAQSDPISSLTSGNSLVNKWRDISRAPARVASTLINPTKMVTQVLSYISPLIGTSKLIDSSSLTQKLASLNATSSGVGGAKIVPRLRLNPFTGRSVNNQASISNLFGFERNKATQDSFVTQSPQTDYLAKPDLNKSPSNASGRQFTTPSTSLFEALMGDSNLANKDLQADSSSPLTVFTEKGGSKADQGEYNESDQEAKSILKPDSASRVWLKNSANQLAQSYLQNSFRGLLTLSQLPILPTGSISSAPSELEKNRLAFITKLKSTNNNNGKHPTIGQNQSSISQTQRKRAIDELYRYAYILSTGVGRKRDPLVALGSAPPPRSFMFNQKQGAFSQRSKGLLSSIQNQKHLLDYAKALTPNALNKAKPRGVMWDMATDPSLAVTVFHLLERASVALPLG